MQRSHFVSPACGSEAEALASVEGNLHDLGAGKKGEVHILSRRAYEVEGVWVAELVVEFVEPEIEEELEPAPQPNNAPEENEGAGLALYAHMHTFNPAMEVPMPEPNVPNMDMSDMDAPSLPQPDIALALDFQDAETQHGLIPVADHVLSAVLQEALVEEARQEEERLALRRRIYAEELATLHPANDVHLRPEPGIAA